MVVDECIGRCLDVGSTPTGSIKAFHILAKLRKTLIYQRFLFLRFAFWRDPKRDQKQVPFTTRRRVVVRIFLFLCFHQDTIPDIKIATRIWWL